MNDVPMNPDNAPLTACLIHGSAWCTCRREASLPSNEVRKALTALNNPALETSPGGETHVDAKKLLGQAQVKRDMGLLARLVDPERAKRTDEQVAAMPEWVRGSPVNMRASTPTPPEAPPTEPVLSASRMEDVIHGLRAALTQRDARIAELERQNKELVRIGGNFGEGSEEDTESFLARIEQGMENLRELELDRERLSWQFINKATVEYELGPDDEDNLMRAWSCSVNGICCYGETVRDVIDAAMEALDAAMKEPVK